MPKNDRPKTKLDCPPRPMPEWISATPDQIASAFFKTARNEAGEGGIRLPVRRHTGK